MKVRIKTTNGEIPSNLTTVKEYDAIRVDSERIRINCDDGQVITNNIKTSYSVSYKQLKEILK